MVTIAERTALVASRLAEVKAHCMCAKLIEDAYTYTVIYPDDYFPNGVRASKGGGKHVALGHLLIVMERHWKDSFL